MCPLQLPQRRLLQFQIAVVVTVTLCMLSVTAWTTSNHISTLSFPLGIEKVISTSTTTPFRKSIRFPRSINLPMSNRRQWSMTHFSTINTGADTSTSTGTPVTTEKQPTQELPPDYGMGKPYDNNLLYMGISQELDELKVGESLFKNVQFNLQRQAQASPQLQKEDQATNNNHNSNSNSNHKTIEIRKLSQRPPLFLLKQILSEQDCNYLHAFSNPNDGDTSNSTTAQWETADTNRGGRDSNSHRVKSKVAWLSNQLHRGLGELARSVQQIFLPFEPFDVFDDMPTPKDDNSLSTTTNNGGGGNRCVEQLQLVQYEPSGQYKLHHDSVLRLVTALYYVNGVSETYFPLADYGRRMRGYGEAMYVGTQICKDMEGNEGGDVGNGSSTVSRGVLVSSNPNSTTRIEKGDAIVFYNYFQDGSMEWNALHAGLPAPSTKLIATHWYHHVPRRRKESDS